MSAWNGSADRHACSCGPGLRHERCRADWALRGPRLRREDQRPRPDVLKQWWNRWTVSIQPPAVTCRDGGIAGRTGPSSRSRVSMPAVGVSVRVEMQRARVVPSDTFTGFHDTDADKRAIAARWESDRCPGVAIRSGGPQRARARPAAAARCGTARGPWPAIPPPMRKTASCLSDPANIDRPLGSGARAADAA